MALCYKAVANMGAAILANPFDPQGQFRGQRLNDRCETLFVVQFAPWHSTPEAVLLSSQSRKKLLLRFDRERAEPRTIRLPEFFDYSRLPMPATAREAVGTLPACNGIFHVAPPRSELRTVLVGVGHFHMARIRTISRNVQCKLSGLVHRRTKVRKMTGVTCKNRTRFPMRRH